MKIEQVLFNRVGSADFNSGWTTKQTPGVRKEILDSFKFRCNTMVAGLNDRLSVMPEELYTVTHTGRNLFCIKGKYISDGRGNMIGHGYIMNDSDYIQIFKHPEQVVGITRFAESIDDEISAIESISGLKRYNIADIISKYNLNAAKLTDLINLIITAVLRKQEHKKQLRIVVDAPIDQFMNISCEIMYCIYKLLPYSLSMITSFSSFAHEKLTGVDILFTNVKPQDNYYELSTGSYKWSKGEYDYKELARVIVSNSGAESLLDGTERFLAAVSLNNSALNIDTLRLAVTCAAQSCGISIASDEDSTRKMFTKLVLIPSAQSSDEALAMLIAYCSANNYMNIPVQQEAAIAKRYIGSKNDHFKQMYVDYLTKYFSVCAEADVDARIKKMMQSNAALFSDLIESAVEIGTERIMMSFVKQLLADETVVDKVKSSAPIAFNAALSYIVNDHFINKLDGNEFLLTLSRKNKRMHYEILQFLSRHKPRELSEYCTDYYLQTLHSFSEMRAVSSAVMNVNDAILIDRYEQTAFTLLNTELRKRFSVNVYNEFINVLRAVNSLNQGRLAEQAKAVFWSCCNFEMWNANEDYSSVYMPGNDTCRKSGTIQNIIRNIARGGFLQQAAEIFVENSFRLSMQAQQNILQQLHSSMKQKSYVANSSISLIIYAYGVNGFKAETFISELERTGKKEEPLRKWNSAVGGEMFEHIARTNPRELYKLYKYLYSNGEYSKLNITNALAQVCRRHNFDISAIERESADNAKMTIASVSAAMLFTTIPIGAVIGELLNGTDLIWSVIAIVIMSLLMALSWSRASSYCISHKWKPSISGLVAALLVSGAMLSLGFGSGYWAFPIALIALIGDAGFIALKR